MDEYVTAVRAVYDALRLSREVAMDRRIKSVRTERENALAFALDILVSRGISDTMNTVAEWLDDNE